jgi:MarR family transcriptional regulator for hemolysin
VLQQRQLDFGIVLGLAYQSFVEQLNAALAQRGFTDIRPAFGYVLRALADQPLTSGQLATRLAITAQGAGKLVDLMVEAGYVERQLDTTDRRTRWLHLTPRGQAALAAAREIHHDIELKLVAKLGAEPMGTLREVLEHVVGSDGPRLLRLP